jgi:hypothetical protein
MAYTLDRDPCPESPRLGAMTLHPTPESVPAHDAGSKNSLPRTIRPARSTTAC